ncbi:MAG: type III pantothenate kinase, partial [candidate division WOR-3 bacterium]
MILTALVGNTNTRLVWWTRGTVRARRILPTVRVLQCARVPGSSRPVKGVAIASVVPRATPVLARTLELATNCSPFVLGPGTRVGLSFRYRRSQLGADRICDAVGAWHLHHDNCIALDFGTAVTVNVVLAEGSFAGGLILPGPDLMLAGLARSTALLPRVELRRKLELIGRTTCAAIQAGVFHILACGLRGVIDEFERATSRSFRVVLTGGRAKLFYRA